jgi:hypothetical protein
LDTIVIKADSKKVKAIAEEKMKLIFYIDENTVSIP